MKKKIGYVISYAEGHNNYGSSLQAYALLSKLLILGYDVEIIRYINQRTLLDQIVLLYKMVQCYETKHKFMILRKKLFLMLNRHYKNNECIRTSSVNLFKEEFLIPYFRVCNSYNELRKCSKRYDTVIVGSDQVWSPLSLYSKFTNLLFVDDQIPRISYASSFGVSKVPKIQIKETAFYLNRFNYISTRETSGKKIIESLTDKKAKVVADPTLLMRGSEWIDFIKNTKIDVSEPYIFCYLLGKNK
ncbi:MAG: polysaccharide pyruvyl transferase family protein, partial [Prolixibacteraceae bacterium]